MAEKSKYPDVLPKVSNPPNYVLRSSKNPDKKKPKKPTRRDKRNAAKVPQVDQVALAKQLGENQQAIMQTPEAKQRFKDSQDPFKNGFFKKTEQAPVDMNKARQAVESRKAEQTNAQKLFAPAIPDIQTDESGNKLASKNGMPVGFATGQRKVGEAAPKNPQLKGETNILLGSTDAESAQRRKQIDNFANNFEAAPQQTRPNSILPQIAPKAPEMPMAPQKQMGPVAAQPAMNVPMLGNDFALPDPPLPDSAYSLITRGSEQVFPGADNVTSTPDESRGFQFPGTKLPQAVPPVVQSSGETYLQPGGFLPRAATMIGDKFYGLFDPMIERGFGINPNLQSKFRGVVDDMVKKYQPAVAARQ